MTELKLAELPDRTPVKHMIVVAPELEQKLRDYADLYRQVYGKGEPVDVLIPYMLEAFVDGDKRFLRARSFKSGNNERSKRKSNLSSSTQAC